MRIAPSARGVFNSISRFNSAKPYRILFVLFAVAVSLLIIPMLLKSSATVGNMLHKNESEANFLASQVVTNNADNGAGSLRQAVINASAGDTITFAIGVTGTITLTSGEILINKSLTIQGPGANVLTISGNNNSRIFFISGSSTTANISGLKFTGGGNTSLGGAISVTSATLNLTSAIVSGNNASSLGGGIQVFTNTSTATITDCLISNNSANFGGGISVATGGTLTVIGSTISGNTGNSSTGASGGGIDSAGTLTVTNSTISGNSVPNSTNNGGGIQINGNTTITNSTITNNSAAGANSAGGIRSRINGSNGTLTIRNTIVADNQNNTTVPDVVGIISSGAFTSSGYNLIGNRGSVTDFNQTGDQTGTGASPLDPMLGSLSNNGGPTQTHALQTGSPAIDKGNAFGSTTDQRGLTRPSDFGSIANASGGDGSDIGAFEIQLSCNPIVTTNANSGAGSLRLAVLDVCSGGTITFSGVTSPITLTSGDIDITKNLTIQGPGASVLSVSGNNSSRIFNISSGVTANISGLTLTSGRDNQGGAIFVQSSTLNLTSVIVSGNTSTSSGGGISLTISGTVSITDSQIINNTATTRGGGIRVLGGTLNVTDSTISGNTANGTAGGGGIDCDTTLQMTNSTVSGNSVPSGANSGGGILTGGTATITNSTITNNSVAGNSGNAGGIRRNNGTTTIRNTIVAANQNNTTLPDVIGTFTSSGYNLIGNVGTVTGFTATGDQTGTGASPLNPMLDPLSSNGGSTPTHALQAGSPAIDKGISFGSTTDQRGLTRPSDSPLITNASGGDGSDIGAFEIQDCTTTVTTNANSGAGSLRQAVADVCSGGTIMFDSGVTGTITLTSGEIAINKNLTIQGPGASVLAVSGNNNSRIFFISGGFTANISGLTLTGGNGSGGVGGAIFLNASNLNLTSAVVSGNSSPSGGGGINLVSSGTITITDSLISNNTADFGGGISSSGTLNVISSTISGNTANSSGGNAAGGINSGDTLTMTNSTVSGNLVPNGSNNGGGIVTLSSTTITNSTVTNNSAAGANSAGGIRRTNGTVTIRNTIIAGNQNNASVPDVFGAFTSSGYNLIGNRGTVTNFNQTGDQTGTGASPLDPMLAPLGNNGGSTPTHALQTGSPAIDKGISFGSTTDQRGLTRPFDIGSIPNASGGDDSDIGAFEVQLPCNPIVTTNANSGAGSLRQAVADVCSGSTITFDSGVTGTITLTSGEIAINKNLTIQGPGASVLTVSGNNASRIFNITNGVTANIGGLTLTGGSSNGGGGIRSDGGTLNLTSAIVSGNNSTTSGGGIFFNTGTATITNSLISNNTATTSGGGVHVINGTLNVTGSTISGNTANDSIGNAAGGIESSGTLTMTNSTVSGNSVTNGSNNGGGMRMSGTGTITNSTITNNTTPVGSLSAGGIRKFSGTLTIRNTIIAANQNNTTVPDVFGSFTSSGFNLIGNVGSVTDFNQTGDQTGTGASPLDPMLDPLDNNGGSTPTHALQAGSPAIDKGNSFGSTTDQRGLTRPFDIASVPNASGDGSDIGAFEVQAPPPSCTTNPIVTTNADSGAGSLRQAVLDACSGGTITFDSGVIGTITLTSGEIAINKNLTIQGPGASVLTVSGNNNSRIFQIINGVTANISGLTLTGGRSDFGGGILVNGSTLNLTSAVVSGNSATSSGGGIHIFTSGSTATITDSLISNNSANFGGGIRAANNITLNVIRNTISGNTANFSGGEAGGGIDCNCILTMTNSTVSGNSAPNAVQNGGGIWISGNSTITNSTITNNSTGGTGSAGGIRRSGGTITIRNTIIAANQNNTTVPDIFTGSSGSFASSGYNLIGNVGSVTDFNQTGDQTGTGASPLDPKLAPLAFNGGATPTHKLKSHSPAIDKGNSSASTTDQRGVGFNRPVDLSDSIYPNASGDDGSDIGAYEVQSISVKTPLDFDGDGKSDYAVIEGSFSRPSREKKASRESEASTESSDNSSVRDENVKAVRLSGDLLADDNQRFWASGYNKLLHLRAGRGFIELPKDVQAAQARWEKEKEQNKNNLTPEVAGLNWLIRKSSDGSTLNYTLGTNTDEFVPADYDGDGKTDAAVWNSTTGFTVIQSSTLSTVNYTLGVNNSNADPSVVGDYDGDGIDDPAIYDKTTGVWTWLGGSSHTTADFATWMANGIPAPGDYDGDGKMDFAVQLPPTSAPDVAKFRIAFNDGTVGPAADIAMTYGLAVYAIVPGDYDGDGITDIAQANLSETDITWKYLSSSTGYTVQVKRKFGVVATDRTVQGDYDGDGKIDFAIYRRASSPNDGVFIVFQSSTSTQSAPFDWGDADDYSVGFYNTH